MVNRLLREYANSVAGYTVSDVEVRELLQGLKDYEVQSVLHASSRRDCRSTGPLAGQN
jgi:hypothetical protein